MALKRKSYQYNHRNVTNTVSSAARQRHVPCMKRQIENKQLSRGIFKLLAVVLIASATLRCFWITFIDIFIKQSSAWFVIMHRKQLREMWMNLWVSLSCFNGNVTLVNSTTLHYFYYILYKIKQAYGYMTKLSSILFFCSNLWEQLT